MEVTEIIQDSFTYPITHLQSLVIYIILGIIGTLAIVTTGVTTLAAAKANSFASIGFFIIGLVISFLIFCVIDGYMLDIIKIGIQRGDGAPSIDIKRQGINGIKLVVVTIIYFIIPFIITVILSLFLANWLVILCAFILFVIFALAASMAQCRLAQTEELEYALEIGQAISDISRVGIGKLVATVIIIAVIAIILALIISGIGQFSNTIGSILTGIFNVYLLFVANRAIGLLYSDV